MTPALSADIDAAIWQRALPESVHAWLDALPDHALPQGRFVLQPDHVLDCLEVVFERLGSPLTPARTWFCEDVQRLATRVEALSGAPLIRLRLEPVFDNACAKFHIDNVTTRLICTYRGPGTQIAVDETAMETIKTVPTGAPILLKGKQWPQAKPPQLKHRSPPIEGTGLVRLMVVLETTNLDDVMPAYDAIFRP